MPQYIIHKDGVFNVFSSVVDAPLIERGLTLEELQEWFRFMQGSAAMVELPERVERALATGTSALSGTTLQELIACNRAGPNETSLPPAEFERRYLSRVGGDPESNSTWEVAADNPSQDHDRTTS